MVPAEKSLLVCEAHLQAQLEGPAGNREALVHGCEDSGRGSGSTARFGKTRTPAGGAVEIVGALGSGQDFVEDTGVLRTPVCP